MTEEGCSSLVLAFIIARPLLSVIPCHPRAGGEKAGTQVTYPQEDRWKTNFNGALVAM